MPAYPRGLPAAYVQYHRWIAGKTSPVYEAITPPDFDGTVSLTAVAVCGKATARALRVHRAGRRDVLPAPPLDTEPSLVDDVVIWMPGFSTDPDIFLWRAGFRPDAMLAGRLQLDLQAKLVDISVARERLVVVHHYRCGCSACAPQGWCGAQWLMDSRCLLMDGRAVQEHPVAL